MLIRSLRALALVVCALAVLGAPAHAKGHKKPAAKKLSYHFEVEQVKAGDGVEGALAADALKLLDAEAKKQFAAHPQLVADLSAAPDPKTDPKGYSAYLKKKKVAGSYAVVVDLTSYSEETEDSPKGDGSKRFVVRLELHMFGETIPERKMGFEGVGGSTIKQDVGKTVRAKDREFTIQGAIEVAVTDAIEKSLAKLAAPPAKAKK
jgi:hypothetical protein